MKKIGYTPWLIYGMGALFYCYEFLLRIAPNAMSEQLMQFYGIGPASLSHLVAFYYYAYAPMQIPVGVLMDRFRPRRLLAGACLLSALSIYLFTATDSLVLAQTGRFLIGLLAAFGFVGILKLATIWLPPERFGMIAGLATSLGMIGAMIGNLLMTRMVDTMGWQNTLNYWAIVGILLSIAIYIIVRDYQSHSHKDKQTITAIPTPILNFKILITGLVSIMKAKQTWLTGLVGCLMYMPLPVFSELWGMPFLEYAHHLTREQAAFGISMTFLGWAIGGPLFGWLSDFVRLRRAPMSVGCLLAVALVSSIIYIPDIPPAWIYTILFLFGVFCSAQVLVFAVTRETHPTQFSGSAIAFTNMLVMIGGIFLQPTVGILLDIQINQEIVSTLKMFTINHYQNALLIVPVALAIGFVLTLLLQETHCQPVESPHVF